MKKLTAILLAAALLLALTACGSEQPAGNEGANSTPTPAQGENAPVESTQTPQNTSDAGEGAEEGAEEGEEYLHEHGFLVQEPGFDNLTRVESDEDFYGGYYYCDDMEGLPVKINSYCFGTEFLDAESIEEYIEQCVEFISEFEYRELSIEDSQFETTFGAYQLSWLTGENEDTNCWEALLVGTDSYTYIYAFCIDADFVEEAAELVQEGFAQLQLIFPDEP